MRRVWGSIAMPTLKDGGKVRQNLFLVQGRVTLGDPSSLFMVIVIDTLLEHTKYRYEHLKYPLCCSM